MFLDVSTSLLTEKIATDKMATCRWVPVASCIFHLRRVAFGEGFILVDPTFCRASMAVQLKKQISWRCGAFQM